MEARLGGDVFFNHGTSNSTGVAILFKRNTNIKIISHKIIIQGRVILLEVDCDSVMYCLVNVYSPNNDDVDFLKTVFLETLGWSRDDFVIVAGDWNTVLNNDLEKMGVLKLMPITKHKIILIILLVIMVWASSSVYHIEMIAFLLISIKSAVPHLV